VEDEADVRLVDPMPNAIVETITSNSSSMNPSWTASRSDALRPAWYARAETPLPARAWAVSSAARRVAT
jgi:hypothetical protein